MQKFKIMFVLTLFSLLCISGSNLIAQDEETYTGVVKGVEWDDDGNTIAAVLVFDFEEENELGDIETITIEYIIEDDDMGKQLYELVGKTVEVIGVLSEDDEGQNLLKVESFTLINMNDDETEVEEPEEPQQ
jgi:hypothetical protein